MIRKILSVVMGLLALESMSQNVSIDEVVVGKNLVTGKKIKGKKYSVKLT
jgi:hypothetical protein